MTLTHTKSYNSDMAGTELAERTEKTVHQKTGPAVGPGERVEVDEVRVRVPRLEYQGLCDRRRWHQGGLVPDDGCFRTNYESRARISTLLELGQILIGGLKHTRGQGNLTLTRLVITAGIGYIEKSDKAIRIRNRQALEMARKSRAVSEG